MKSLTSSLVHRLIFPSNTLENSPLRRVSIPAAPLFKGIHASASKRKTVNTFVDPCRPFPVSCNPSPAAGGLRGIKIEKIAFAFLTTQDVDKLIFLSPHPPPWFVNFGQTRA